MRSRVSAWPCAALGRFLLWLALALVLVPACWAQPAASAPLELRFDAAEFAVGDTAHPPADGWQQQALPDEWAQNHRDLDGIAWYRVRFRLQEQPAQSLVLYVSRVAVTAEFRLNGSVLNPEVRFTPPGGLLGSQMTNRPQWLVLPAGLFRAGDNELMVRVQGDPVTGGSLSALRIGPAETLRNAWLLRHVPQQVVPAVLFVLLGTTFVIALGVWWRVRSPIHGHFVLAMGLWTTLLYGYYFPEPPVTRAVLLMCMAVLLIGFRWALLGLCWRFSRSTWHWFPKVLNVALGGSLTAALLMIAFGLRLDLLAWALLPGQLLRLLTAVMLCHWAWRERTWQAWALAGAEVIWFSGTLQFILIVMHVIPAEPFMISPADGLPLFLVLVALYLHRLTSELNQAKLGQQAAIHAERLRILHDMHDGMGAQLITALRLARLPEASAGAVARNIEDALQDLRLIIDSLALSDEQLLPLLGNLRYRLQPRLGELGIRLDWHVQAVPDLSGLTPQSALGVLRIVQEALNNALRHARATNLVVTIGSRGKALAIDIEDDGVGFDPAAKRSGGRGLTGMQQRAARLGGSVSVLVREAGGTVVSLTVPPGSMAALAARPA